MSGARISAGGNAVKPSPPGGIRGTGSAHPERSKADKPGTPQKKVDKSGSKNVQPSSNTSQPQVHVDDTEVSPKVEMNKEVPSRLKAAHDTHAHHKGTCSCIGMLTDDFSRSFSKWRTFSANGNKNVRHLRV